MSSSLKQNHSLALSDRCRSVTQSDIRAMSQACARLGGINLSQGVCDTPVPEIVLKGAADALMNGRNTYTAHVGMRQLREAIAPKQHRFTGMDLDPDREIVVSSGATGAMYCAFMALLNPGDEVILFEPFYGYHVSSLVACDAVPVFVPLEGAGWGFDPERLEAAVTPRTKALLINTPANPSGKVFSRDELLQLAGFAERHDLFVFTDEMYEHFIYDGLRHCSFATLPGMRERTITISGLSKTFSITGWRIGYAMCDAKWAEAIGHFNDLVYVCAPSPLQLGVAVGLLGLGDDYYHGLADEYGARRDLFCRALVDAGLPPSVPQGAYYVLADLSSVPGGTAREKAMHLLEATGVASVPASAFYADGGGEAMVRFCFAKEPHVLEEACSRLKHLRAG